LSQIIDWHVASPKARNTRNKRTFSLHTDSTGCGCVHIWQRRLCARKGVWLKHKPPAGTVARESSSPSVRATVWTHPSVFHVMLTIAHLQSRLVWWLRYSRLDKGLRRVPVATLLGQPKKTHGEMVVGGGWLHESVCVSIIVSWSRWHHGVVTYTEPYTIEPCRVIGRAASDQCPWEAWPQLANRRACAACLCVLNEPMQQSPHSTPKQAGSTQDLQRCFISIHRIMGQPLCVATSSPSWYN
jgi:hypothetical protein